MPTAVEYQAAAAEFSAVSAELQALSSSLGAIDVSSVLQGGRLGRLVPERLATCASQAVDASSRAEVAAQVCRERAAIIAAYEAELAAYDAAMRIYEAQLIGYYLALSSAESLAAREDVGFYEPVFVPAPRLPTPPAAPPWWADVRRP